MPKKRKKEQSLLDLLIQAEAEGEPAPPAERDLPQPPRAQVPEAYHTPLMRLESLEIKNLWCYEQAQITFEEGITVIAGPNGSGKSSLLESIFFALYGSKAGPAMERALSDVLRIGTDAGSVQLGFQYGSRRYRVRMALRRRGDTVISDKESCRLSSDGEEWIGVENVAQAIEALFGMNRDDFTNCVYVRQGEIDRLIRAGEEERRRMIDRLLRLEKLDRYAQRAREGARRALNRRLDVLQHLALDFRREIESIEAERPEKRRAKIEEAIKEKQEELKDIEEKISQVEGVQHDLREKLKRFEELTLEVEERKREYARKERQLQQQEQKIEKLNSERGQLKRRYKELESGMSKGLDQLELPKESILSSFNRASSWEEIERLPDELSQVKSRQEALHAEIQERQKGLAKGKEKLIGEREGFLKALVQVETQKKNLERERDEMRALIEQGKCPVCRQPVSEKTFQGELEGRESEIKRLASELKQHRDKLKELESQIGALAREGDETLRQMDEEFKALETRRTQLERLKELVLEMLKVKEQGLEKKELRKATLEAAEALRDELSNIKRKIEDLQKGMGDSSELKAQWQKAQKLHEKLSEQKTKLQKEIEGLLHERGALDQRLEQLKRLKQSQKETEQELEKLEALQEELEKLTGFYGALKKELRLRNIEALELYFNQFFKLMDSGASYRGVRVTEDYEIFVELKSGDVIRPELLSGGERALINIALRAAIHQVLSQAASRMPLILDEPTIYLDRERINRLQFLLEELGGRIGQVIVVSHEVGLVEGADHEYRTEKLADNTSRVYRVR